MNRHSLVQISLFFKKTKFTHLKSIYFHFKKPSILVFFEQNWGKVSFGKILWNVRARPQKNLIRQKR